MTVDRRYLSGRTVSGGLLIVLGALLIAGNLGPYTVQAPLGDVTFHAGGSITIHNGFIVEQGAKFTAIVDE